MVCAQVFKFVVVVAQVSAVYFMLDPPVRLTRTGAVTTRELISCGFPYIFRRCFVAAVILENMLFVLEQEAFKL